MHPWWHSTLVAVPAIVLAAVGLRDSREANKLRAQNNQLHQELDSERNKHLQQIATNTKKPVTQAERNAEVLRRHLRAKVSVSEAHGTWAGAPEIVEVGEDGTVTLFTPRDYSSSVAWCAKVSCGDLEITDIPIGSCPLRLRVLKRYGSDVQLGEITKWEDRHTPGANPTFARGGMACHATYSKPGSPEQHSLQVYASNDGANSFLLVASTGEQILGNNIEVSKRFMGLQIDYEASGFNRSSSGSGGGAYRLFVC